MEQDAAAVPQQAFDWRSALRKHRRERRLTLQEAAGRSGLSLATVKAYEHGSRRPSERSLRALIAGLGLPREDGNRILGGAGYAVDWYAIFHERFFVPDEATVQAELEALPWPAFITNQSFDVLKWNGTLARVLSVDIDARGEGFLERNLLGSITEEAFARRLLNWDEVVSFMIGLAKGDPRATNEPEAPASWLRPAVSRLLGGSPQRVTRLMRAAMAERAADPAHAAAPLSRGVGCGRWPVDVHRVVRAGRPLERTALERVGARGRRYMEAPRSLTIARR